MSMDEIASYKPNKCPKHDIILVRSYGDIQLSGTSGGTFLSEHDLLKKKQEQRKVRSRAHFKNTMLHKIKDPAERRHFEKKFKGTKKIDHEKM